MTLLVTQNYKKRLYLCIHSGMSFFQTPSAEDHVDLHFVAIVHKDGSLYELGKRS